MKIIITGGNGMLGTTLRRRLTGHTLVVADLPEHDITDRNGFIDFVVSERPDTVIHCAAMTQVDNCESSPDLAWQLNAIGSRNVAEACAQVGAKCIAISTDYVFSGDLGRPYTELDATSPKTVYGKTKLAGEEFVREFAPNHIIARVAWLYGANGPSFVHTMINLARQGKTELKVVADQFGNPTGATAVAQALQTLLERPELVGTFHLTCEGEASWFEFAEAIFELSGIAMKVTPCTTEEFPRPAPRPKDSRLEKLMLREHALPPMPHWRDTLAEFLRELPPA